MADWWDSISDGFSSVTDWLGGSGGKALTTGVGLVGAGMDIYSGIQNQSNADRYANLAFATAKQQDKYTQELVDRQKSLYWPLEDLQNQLTTNQLNMAMSPDYWNQYAANSLQSLQLQNQANNVASQQNQLATNQLNMAMSPDYWNQYAANSLQRLQLQNQTNNVASQQNSYTSQMLGLAGLSAQYSQEDLQALRGLTTAQRDYAISRGLSDIQQQQSLDQTYYDTEKSVIRKLTEGEDVLRDRMMNQAQTDTNVAYAQSADELRAQLGLAGVSTSSQQAVNALTQLKQSEALAQAGAMTSAARTAEDTSLSRQSQALNYWKGSTLPSYQYTTAGNQTSATGSNTSDLYGSTSATGSNTSNLYGSTSASGSNYTGNALSALSGSSSAYNSLYNSANNAAQQNWTGLGSILQNLNKQYIK